MLFYEKRHEPGRPPSAVPLVWMMVALVGSAVVASLSLPALPYPPVPYPNDDLFNPAWFVAGALLVFPVYLASRSCWWMALPSVVLPSAQAYYIAATAVQRYHDGGLSVTGARMWYVVTLVQVLLFASAGWVGARRNRTDRRIARLVDALARVESVERGRDGRRRSRPRRLDR